MEIEWGLGIGLFHIVNNFRGKEKYQLYLKKNQKANKQLLFKC